MTIQKRFPIGAEVKITNMPKKSKFIETPDPMSKLVGQKFKVLGYSRLDNFNQIVVKLNTAIAKDEFIDSKMSPSNLFFMPSWLHCYVYTNKNKLKKDFPIGTLVSINSSMEDEQYLGVDPIMRQNVGKTIEVLGYQELTYEGNIYYCLKTSLTNTKKDNLYFLPQWVTKLEVAEDNEVAESISENSSSWNTVVGGTAVALLGATLLKKTFNKQKIKVSKKRKEEVEKQSIN